MSQKICSVPECGRPLHQRGICKRHHTKQWRWGDPNWKPFSNGHDPSPEGVEWRIVPSYPHYEASNTGHVRLRAEFCTKRDHGKPRRGAPGKPGGYLLVIIEGQVGASVHRMVCEAFHGPAPTPKHQVAHWNGNRQDNQPDNLRWATGHENYLDKLRHDTAQRGIKHWGARLTDDAVRSIRARPNTTSTASLAREFGVSEQTIAGVRKGRTWTHVQASLEPTGILIDDGSVVGAAASATDSAILQAAEFAETVTEGVAETSKGFWVICEACAHCWISAFYSIEGLRFSRAAAANSRVCPKCGGKKINVAKQDNGELLEGRP